MTTNTEAALAVLHEQAAPEQRGELPSYPVEDGELVSILQGSRVAAVEQTILDEDLPPDEAEALRQAQWEVDNAEAAQEGETGEPPTPAPAPETPAIPAEAGYQLGQEAQGVATARANLQAEWQVLDQQYRQLEAQKIALEASGLRQTNPGQYSAALTDIANASANIQSRANQIRSQHAEVEKYAGQLGQAYQELAQAHEHRQAEVALKGMGLAFDSATKAVLAEVASTLGYNPRQVSRARDVVTLVKLAQAEGKLPGSRPLSEASPVPTLDPVEAVIKERNLPPGSIEAVALHLQARDRGQRPPPPAKSQRDSYLSAAKRLGYL